VLNSRTDQIDAGGDHQFSAYVSQPERPNGHAVVVLQEIFGITPHIRGIADRFAEDGYLALAPDLFWRLEPGVSLSHSKEDMARAFALAQQFDESRGVDDIASTVAHVQRLPGFAGKVAVAGMCLGGKLAYLAAARGVGAAAVAYYGVGIEKSLDEAGRIRGPLMLAFGDKDRYVPQSARDQIATALAGRPGVVIHVYEGADHGFYTRGEAATVALARQRTNDFLQQALGAAAA
jgi:carboxymethylenebutenolidase